MKIISKQIINKAIAAATNSDVIRGKVGAVLFTNSGHIIASACNFTFHGSSRIRTIHAEEALLQKAYKINAMERYGEDLNVFVVRWVIGTKRMALAKPCPACKKILDKTKFRVYYSNSYGGIEILN